MKLFFALALVISLASNSLYADVSKWAKDSVYIMDSLDLIPASIDHVDKMQKDITRLEFAEFIFNYYDLITVSNINNFGDTNNFKDVDNKKVNALYALGIVNGTSDTTFSPNKRITREQMATMIMRTVEKLDLKLAKNSKDNLFQDDKKIANWAKKGVYFCRNNHLISGKGNNSFDPKAYTTVEQVACIIDRACKLSNKSPRLNSKTKDFNSYKIPEKNTSGIAFSSNKKTGMQIRFILGDFEDAKTKDIDLQINDMYLALKDKIPYKDLSLVMDTVRKAWSVTDSSFDYDKKYYVKNGKLMTSEPAKPYIKIDSSGLMYVEVIK